MGVKIVLDIFVSIITWFFAFLAGFGIGDGNIAKEHKFFTMSLIFISIVGMILINIH